MSVILTLCPKCYCYCLAAPLIVVPDAKPKRKKK